MVSGYPDFHKPVIWTDQIVGVWDQPVWASKQGIQKFFLGDIHVAAGGFDTFIDYIVPSGKTLYITVISFSRFSDEGPLWIRIADVTAGVYIMYTAAYCGHAFSLSTPIVIPGGHRLQVDAGNNGSTDSYLEVSIGGFEI